MSIAATSRARKGREPPGTPSRLKPGLASYVMLVEGTALAALVGGAVAASDSYSTTVLVRVAVIVGLYVGYRELTARVELIRQFVHLHRPEARSDQSSVWTLAAALTLPLGWAAGVVVVVTTHTYLRARGHQAVRLHRLVFSRSTTLLGVAAAWALDSYVPAGRGSAEQAALLAAQLLAYTLVSLLPAVGYLYLEQPRASRPRFRSLLPPRSNLVMEGESLLAGLLLARMLVDNIWLAPIAALLPLMLQRAGNADAAATAARTDAKTGVLTARAWRENVVRQRCVGALLMLDVDRFKSVNDTCGHLAGDRLLGAIGGALQRDLRAEDQLGRFGGEEFCVWLPRADAAAAAGVAERLRAAVAALRVPSDDGHLLSATVSIGIALGDVASLDELLTRADRALYAAKAAGRNRANAASDPVS